MIVPVSHAGRSSLHDSIKVLGMDNWILEADFSCFILESHEIGLQKVPLINMVRQEESKAVRVVSLLVLASLYCLLMLFCLNRARDSFH